MLYQTYYYYWHEQPGAGAKTNGTKMTKLGIQNVRRARGDMIETYTWLL